MSVRRRKVKIAIDRGGKIATGSTAKHKFDTTPAGLRDKCGVSERVAPSVDQVTGDARFALYCGQVGKNVNPTDF